MATEDYRSCATHCCRNHGCKYGLEGCPVAAGQVEQAYLCEYCTWELEEREIFEFNTVATTVMVGYKRTDGTIEALPTDEQVQAALRRALMGLEVAPGWAITVVED